MRRRVLREETMCGAAHLHIAVQHAGDRLLREGRCSDAPPIVSSTSNLVDWARTERLRALFFRLRAERGEAAVPRGCCA